MSKSDKPSDPADKAEAVDDLDAKKAANKAAAKEDKATRRKLEASEREEKRVAKMVDAPSPSWWVPTLCTFMVVGLFWLVVYYLTGEKFPIPGIGLGNMVIGFLLILIGFGMTTRWR